MPLRSKSWLERSECPIVVHNTRLLPFARNDNINKIKPFVSLRGVPPLRDDAAISNLDPFDIIKLKSKFGMGCDCAPSRQKMDGYFPINPGRNRAICGYKVIRKVTNRIAMRKGKAPLKTSSRGASLAMLATV